MEAVELRESDSDIDESDWLSSIESSFTSSSSESADCTHPTSSK